MNARGPGAAKRPRSPARAPRSSPARSIALLAAGVLLVLGPATADAQRRELATDQVALLEAIRDDDLLQIRALAAAGMDLNEPLAGTLTALGFAITAGKPDVVETLLDVGAEVPPQYTEQVIALMTGNLEHGERIAELLRNARGRDAEPVPDGLDPADLPRVDRPGTYLPQHYAGPCSVEGEWSRAGVTEGTREWTRATRTLFFPAGRVPAAPARAEHRADAGRVDLGVLPLRGYIRAISPADCEPVRLGGGPYTIIIETLYTESVWECNVPGCGPGRGWLRLMPVIATAERRRIDGVVIEATDADETQADEPAAEPDQPLRAHAGGPYLTSRGAEIRLDGSGSAGGIVSWEWTFEPGADCPAEAPFDAGARKEGATPSVVALCGLEATLTVSDGSSTAADRTRITVVPREWSTPSEHHDEGLAPRGGARLITTERGAGGAWTIPEISFAQNVSVVGDRAEAWLLLDPVRSDGGWLDLGYSIVTVSDPGGPFDGVFHLDAYRIEMHRRTLINPYVVSDTLAPMRGMATFYEYNQEQGRQAELEAFLESLRAHEREHTVLKQGALEGDADPGHALERLFGSDAEELQREADERLRETEREACRASASLHRNPLGGDLRSYDLYWPTPEGGWVRLTLPPYSRATAAEHAEALRVCDR
jgi:hypothetical protein